VIIGSLQEAWNGGDEKNGFFVGEDFASQHEKPAEQTLPLGSGGKRISIKGKNSVMGEGGGCLTLTDF